MAHIDETHFKIILDRDRANITEDAYNIRLANLPHETVYHLFLDCQQVRLITRNICVNGLGWGVFEEKKYLMGDFWTNSLEGITVRCLGFHYVKYIIYTLRKSRVLPTMQKVRYELLSFMHKLRKNRTWEPFLRHINMV